MYKKHQINKIIRFTKITIYTRITRENAITRITILIFFARVTRSIKIPWFQSESVSRGERCVLVVRRPMPPTATWQGGMITSHQKCISCIWKTAKGGGVCTWGDINCEDAFQCTTAQDDTTMRPPCTYQCTYQRLAKLSVATLNSVTCPFSRQG